MINNVWFFYTGESVNIKGLLPTNHRIGRQLHVIDKEKVHTE